jgi:hypothetical protein
MDSNPVGRPSTYKPEYCQMLMDHMEKGFSLESFGGVVRAAKSTIYEWIKNYPEFSDAVALGKTLCQLRWEEFGKDMMMGKVFGGSSTIYIFNMKNRFGWRDQPVESMVDNKQRQITLNYDPKKKQVKDES